MKQTKTIRTKLHCLTACAEYILAFDSEWDDFDEHISNGGDPFGHILADAYIAVNSLAEFEAYVAEVRAKVSK